MSGKAAAEKAVKAVTGINWGLLERLVKSEDGKREMMVLRRTIDETRAQLNSIRGRKPVKIDWDYFKQELSPELVDQFKGAYENIQIGEYKEELTPKYQQQIKELVKKAGEAAQEAKKEQAKLEAELKGLDKQKSALKTLTADEYFKDHPKTLEKIDDEIRQGIWGPKEKE